MNRKAQDSIIAAEYETISQGGNKRDWADVSKNVQGMAKFNPYIKDAFKTFSAQDIYRAVIRHKINDWDNELDDKYKNKAWAIYYPLFISGIILIVSALLLNFFLK